MAHRKIRTALGAVAALAVVCALPTAASAAPGQIDSTFGVLNNGTVTTNHGRHDFVVKVLRQTDGKFLTVAQGSDANLEPTMVVSRYLANGRVDSAFGASGSVTTTIQGNGFVSDAVLQSDGKIVIVGWTSAPADFFVTRLLPNGTRDPAFATAHPTTNFGGSSVDQAFAVALGAGGTIVVTGRANNNVALARYTATGALDSTFSGDGLTTHDFGGQSEADGVAVIAGGKIVVSGRENTASGAPRVVLARFNANGTLDATFGTGGRVAPASTPIGSASELLVQGTKLVIAGTITLSKAGIARYNANGTIDNSFGSGGTTSITVGKFLSARDLVADGSGRLVLVGMSANLDNFPGVNSVVTLFRFSSNGARDAAFGCGGRVLTEVLGNGAGTNYNAAGASSAVAVGNDIVVGGFASAFDATDLPPTDDLLARYDGDLPARPGYALLRGDGGSSAFGGAPACGSAFGLPLQAPIVGMAFDPVAAGSWSVAADGGIFSFGAARFFGSTGAMHLNQPVVGMAATKTGNGYWLVARDGGIFAFGDARFFGSTGAIHLNQPIVGMARTKSGNGYWLVARDGGIFAFGDARFAGSMGGSHLNQPVVGMAADPDGAGYWLVAADGGIFSFAAGFSGSTGAIHLNQPIVGMAADPDGTGYWMAARDGGLFAFAAAFSGSTGATPFPVGSTRSTIAITASP